jgi:hypothetical protein
MAGVVEWALMAPGGVLMTESPITLRNTKIDRSIRFGDRENGIDLVWDDATDLENVVFHNASGSVAPLRYGDLVGIDVDGGGFLYYAEQDEGINLRYSGARVTEWEVTGRSIGVEVEAGQTVGLLNTAHGDHMVYAERPTGINLRWYADIRLNTLAPFFLYPPIPMPNRFRAPAREAAQIQVAGEARQVTLFHGQSDDELDWHVYVSLEPEDRREITRHLRNHARGASGVTERNLDQLYSELMVLDASDKPIFGDDQFRSADIGRALALPQSAWDYSEIAIDEQGSSIDLTGESQLTRQGALVYLQGCLVNDAAHGFTPELHPLDSIAYAMDAEDRLLRVRAGDSDWPARLVTWRVGVFTNSDIHRINVADYLNVERRTTWFLDLPSDAGLGRVSVERNYPRFFNHGRGAQDVGDTRPTRDDRYDYYDRITDRYSIETDPRDGVRRPRVEIRMERPDDWGGMFLAEYTIQALRFGRPDVLVDAPDVAIETRSASPRRRSPLSEVIEVARTRRVRRRIDPSTSAEPPEAEPPID